MTPQDRYFFDHRDSVVASFSRMEAVSPAFGSFLGQARRQERPRSLRSKSPAVRRDVGQDPPAAGLEIERLWVPADKA